MATVVIIPGSFVFGKLYKTQVDSLAKQGIPTAVVDLPSVGPRVQGPATMSDDVDEIVRVVEPLLDQGKEIVLFTHSYGGIPTTESLKVLSSKSRAANGKTGGVNSVVYLASIILSPGTSNWDLFGDKLNEFVTIENNCMSMAPEVIGTITFSDIPQEQGVALAAENTSSHSVLSFKEPLTYAGYKDVQVHYIFCEKDIVVPPEAQTSFIETLETSAGDDKVTVHKIDSGHAPVISRPEEVTAFIKQAVSA